ncbi:MAG: inorganic phosphate transporter [Nitrososphaerales archaeon]|nr:inorganic phosphate transporter [Nitrososphaerales archaeon]
MVEVLLILAAALSFLFGWNNSSYLIGNMAGSGTLSLRASIVVTALGMLAGVVFEGQKMLTSLVGSLAFPVSGWGVTLTFALSIVLIFALTATKLPAPVSSAMVGGFLGFAVGMGATVNVGQTELVVTFWFVAPLLTAAAAFAIHRVITRLISSLSLIAADSFNRVGMVACSFAVSYTLGANNLGLIAGTSLSGSPVGNAALVASALALIAVAGMLLLGRGAVSGTVGDRLLSLSPQGVISVFASSAILVWVGTQLAVPTSISQCVLGGMLGAAFSQRTAFVNVKLAYEALSTWVLIPTIAFVLAFMIVYA